MAVTLRPTIPVQQNSGGPAQRVKVEGIVRPMFTLAWHPNRGWELVDGKFVPQLSEFPHQPGVNNVKKNGDALYALSRQQQKGWVIVPATSATPDDTPDQGPGYVRAWPGDRGTHHEHAWVSYVGSHGRWTRQIDDKGYAAWRWSLVERGLLPAIDAAGVQTMREKLQKQRDRFAGRADVNPYAASALKAIDEQIAAFEKAAAAALKPTTSRRRSST
jgi:hypothetical protein